MKGIRRTVIGTIGDKNPIDYGGGVVVRVSQRGKSHTILEYTPGMDAEHPGSAAYSPAQERSAKLTVYMVHIADDVNSQIDWVDWKEFGWGTAMNREDVAQLRESARSKDPYDRAAVLAYVASEYGWNSFDREPLILTQAELRKRWKM